MERHDRVISFIWIFLGLAQCLQSWALGLGSLSEPESGFMPFVVGVGIILLSALLLLEFRLEAKRTPAQKSGPWAGTDWKRLIYVTLLLLGYALFLSKLGYLLATFLFMVLLLRTGERLRWPLAILIGILTSGLSYLIFGFWLSVSFPQGILHF